MTHLSPYSTGNRIPPARVGARVGHYRLALGIIGSHWGVVFGPQEFLDTNMLVLATRKFRVAVE